MGDCTTSNSKGEEKEKDKLEGENYADGYLFLQAAAHVLTMRLVVQYFSGSSCFGGMSLCLNLYNIFVAVPVSGICNHFMLMVVQYFCGSSCFGVGGRGGASLA